MIESANVRAQNKLRAALKLLKDAEMLNYQPLYYNCEGAYIEVISTVEHCIKEFDDIIRTEEMGL